MELEDLKQRWTSLEERLKKQEILNEKLVREIRHTKSGPLNVLINYIYFGIVLCTLAIPLVIYTYSRTYFGGFKTFIFVLAVILLVISIIIGIKNLFHLKRVDFTKNISDNIYHIQTFKINNKKQNLVGYIGATLIFMLVLIACVLSPDMELWRWIVIGLAAPVAIIASYLEYNKIYKAQTNALLRCLDELKELEEDKNS